MSNNSNLPKTIRVSSIKPRRTVMLVDSSTINRAKYRDYLKAEVQYRYIFIEAATGAEALDLYGQDRPDIILLDYLLPDIESLKWLSLWQQQYDKLCPVIILISSENENIAIQSLEMGVVDYFFKGQISPVKLKLAVEREIELRQLREKKEDLKNRLTLSNKEFIQSKISCHLEYTKNNLQKIIDYAPIVVYAKDVDPKTKKSGKFWLVNREFERVFGLLELEIIGKSDRELFSPEIADAFAANDLLIIESKKALTVEERVLNFQGELETYLSLKFPLFNEQQQVVSIVGIAQNITREKQVENELLKSEAKFRSIFEQAAVGIARVAIDGRWIEVNQKLCQIVGYSPEELLKKTFHEITHPEDLDTDLEYAGQILAGQIQTYSMEKRYIRKDGSLVWIDLTVSLRKNSDGEPDYFISVIEDISDRKKLESSLQKSLERLSNLHQIDKAILAAEKPSTIALTAIEYIQNLLTCQRVSIVTFNWEQKTSTILATQGAGNKILSNDLQMPLDTWQEVIARLQEERIERGYIVVDLDRLPLSSQIAMALKSTQLNCFIAFPLKSQNNLLGILKLWVAHPETITIEELTTIQEIASQVAIALEQARLYKKTQNYASELEAKVAQRTAQIEEINQELKAFTSTISHDLKAPLRGIYGFAWALQEDYGDRLDDLGREYTSRLIFSAQQMTQLIEDLLTYSRLSRTQIELKPINLLTIINRVREQLKPEIERNKATITVVEPLSTMIGNQTILFQVISNLISNAIKFIPPTVRPQIRIRTEIIKAERDEIANNVRLWIEDNGIGIEPEYQERIFRVFERLHGLEAYPGTGIGLAIVKKGMERIRGKFGLESALNSGSRFWIEGRKE